MGANLGSQPALEVEPGWIRVVESGEGKFTQDLLDGRHRLLADEPVEGDGDDRCLGGIAMQIELAREAPACLLQPGAE